MFKKIATFILLLIALTTFTLLVTLIPEILGSELTSEDGMKNLQNIFGEHYFWCLFVILVIALMALMFFTPEQAMALFKSNEKPIAFTLKENEQNYQTIRSYLHQRYKRRLSQKLAGRQPVNLRVIPTDDGTSKETSATFVTYQSKEIGPTLACDFQKAHGRLLVTGAPGAGKTTLLLQLALELNSNEKEHLPVLLNLATWSNKFTFLDEWLRKILPAELGVTKKYAAEILKQDCLILLLDGFDEVKEEYRSSCLETIGVYGEMEGRRYVISSRKNEYRKIAKDAPVWLQVEVGPLNFGQMEAELKRISYSQPEAPPLLQAFLHDPLLREAAQVPFYFNTLQLLFSGGKKLSDFNFRADTVKGRQSEIMENFIKRELASVSLRNYKPEQVKYWLAFFSSRLWFCNMVEFELLNLQYDWWKWNRLEAFRAGLMQGVVIATDSVLIGVFTVLLMSAIFEGQFLGLVIVLLCWPLIVLFYGIFSFIKNELPFIYCRDEVKFSFSILIGYLKKRWVWNLILGVMLAISTKLILGFPFDLMWDLKLIIGIIFIAIMAGVSKTFNSESTKFLNINSPYQRFNASAKTLHLSFFQHLMLRSQLFQKGLLPLHLVEFLDEMTHRHILETDGARWRFRHKLIMEYFTKMWIERKKKINSG